jgi:hypothetical protein
VARVCSQCREPVTPVNLCICDDDDAPGGSDEDDEAA